ncbi:NADPH-dependent FMN reductase [Maribacter aestuarii]|uniref:NADPH-dependent FMN reductase n=1 Tax=Maribacter aestuarii TaxID=1130723 RepID=UPI00248BD070|nr:NAD(P)H-dependent oxidoreductase [Maribacter aestuarii]
MQYILGFAGSNSSTSINYKLVRYTTSLINAYEIRLMDMAKNPLPMYSEDYEKENGFSDALKWIKNNIQNCEGLVISVNEHNSYPSAYFKNLVDWLSRLDKNCFKDKKVLLMSTSGGKRGAQGSLEVSKLMLQRFGANIIETFSLPGFHDNFHLEKGILDQELKQRHKEALTTFLESIT